MALAALLLVLAPPAKPVDKLTLELYQGFAVVRRGGNVLREPLSRAPVPPKLSVAFRRDKNYAVWDERGLTIRLGSRLASTRLEDVAVSPKAQSKAEIRSTLEKIKQGERTKGANALSGSRRLGSMGYFLARWTEKGGETWLEALMSVDLTENTLHPKFVGRFEGLSLAAQSLDDRLRTQGKSLAVMTRTAKEWGLATFDPATGKFDFQTYGATLESMSPDGWFVEQSTYGTHVAAKVEFETGERKVYAESRAPMRFLDEQLPPLIRETGIIRNGSTGALTAIPKDSGILRCGGYVVVYTPATNPKSATLFDPVGWTKLADWSKAE